MRASEYESDDLINNISAMWNFLMVFVFIAPVYRLIHNIVNEKQQKVRELMKMMGLTDFPYWLSWFCYYLVIITILSILMTIIMIPMFPNSNKFLIFVYFWLYGMALFSYSVFISSFFSNGKVASIAGSLVLFFSSFLILIVADEKGNQGAKHIFSLFPVVAIQLASPIMFAFEGGGTGLNFDNTNVTYYNYRVSFCFMWLIIGFFFFFVLGIYLENVLP